MPGDGRTVVRTITVIVLMLLGTVAPNNVNGRSADVRTVGAEPGSAMFAACGEVCAPHGDALSATGTRQQLPSSDRRLQAFTRSPTDDGRRRR